MSVTEILEKLLPGSESLPAYIASSAWKGLNFIILNWRQVLTVYEYGSRFPLIAAFLSRSCNFFFYLFTLVLYN